MKTPAPDDAPPDEPIRVRLNTSLIERPFFAGVDLEFMLFGGFNLWTAFMLFKLTLGGPSLPLKSLPS